MYITDIEVNDGHKSANFFNYLDPSWEIFQGICLPETAHFVFYF